CHLSWVGSHESTLEHRFTQRGLHAILDRRWGPEVWVGAVAWTALWTAGPASQISGGYRVRWGGIIPFVTDGHLEDILKKMPGGKADKLVICKGRWQPLVKPPGQVKM